MRPVTLHPSSVLVGFALAGLLVVVGAARTQIPDLVQARFEASIPGIPDPSELVEVREEDSAFTIPEGRRLVLVSSWVEGTRGSVQQSVLLKGPSDAVFLQTGGSDWSGRVFLDGPRTFRVQDLESLSRLDARLVGYLVDIE